MEYLALYLTLVCLLSPTLAYLSFQESLPNGNNVPHPCKVNYRWPGLGHENPQGGGPRNPFGTDFKSAGYTWTQDLCYKDSDGDGMTNGEELGDPNCVWTRGQTPSRLTEISHPGVCEPHDSAQCMGRNDFLSCEVEGFDDCDTINQPDVQTQNLIFSQTTIPPTETNYYCMTFDLGLPAGRDFHMIATEPVVDNAEVLHHMILYGCSENSTTNFPAPDTCGMASADGGCTTILGLWAVGKNGQCFKEGTGYRLGMMGYRRVMLETHYNNPMMKQGMMDASGLRIHYQPARPEVQDLATFMIGQNFLEIPPGKSAHTHTGSCPGSCTRQMVADTAYITGVLNHAHYLGRSIKVEQFRNGQLVKVLSNDEFYSYDAPIEHLHEPPAELRPGDELITTCVFNSLSYENYVYYGEGTQDEMCFSFLTVYPASALRTQNCVANGILDTCSLYGGVPVGECNWGQLFSGEDAEAQAIMESLRKYCKLNGHCRPGCKEVTDRLHKHPCFVGEVGSTIKNILQYSEFGLEFLGRMHVCPAKDDNEDNCRDQCQDICFPDGNTPNSGRRPAAMLLTLLFPLVGLLFGM